MDYANTIFEHIIHKILDSGKVCPGMEALKKKMNFKFVSDALFCLGCQKVSRGDLERVKNCSNSIDKIKFTKNVRE